MRAKFPLASGLVVGTISTAPAVASAQPIGVDAVTQQSDVVRAIASFVLVALVGAVVLHVRRASIDRAVTATAERPLVAVAYGLLAYVLVLFFVLYAGDLIVRLGATGSPLRYAALAILIGGLALIAGVGYLVVGTLVTDVLDEYRPWQGLVVGAVLSAIGWFALPTTVAIAAWVLVPAVGIGGPMRRWVHRERTVETEAPSR